MKATVRIGPAGWSYADWEGIVYPSPRERGFDPLAYLARYFDTVEINSTFYRPPDPATSAKWVQRVGPNPEFRFSVKLYRNFTHDRESLTGQERRHWDTGIEPFREAGKLGAVLAQFPYSFHCTKENLDYLAHLRESFPDQPLVLEVRHRSWIKPEVFSALREFGFGFCNIDQPQVSYSAPPTAEATSPVGYVRLHGRNARDWFREGAGRDARYNYLYPEKELQEWLPRIERIRERTRDLFVITNNHWRGQAVCNALELRAMVGNTAVPVPASLLPLYPQLRSVQIR